MPDTPPPNTGSNLAATPSTSTPFENLPRVDPLIARPFESALRLTINLPGHPDPRSRMDQHGLDEPTPAQAHSIIDLTNQVYSPSSPDYEELNEYAALERSIIVLSPEPELESDLATLSRPSRSYAEAARALHGGSNANLGTDAALQHPTIHGPNAHVDDIAEHDDDDDDHPNEDEDEDGTLFFTSLRAGLSSRNRRSMTTTRTVGDLPRRTPIPTEDEVELQRLISALDEVEAVRNSFRATFSAPPQPPQGLEDDDTHRRGPDSTESIEWSIWNDPQDEAETDGAVPHLGREATRTDDGEEADDSFWPFTVPYDWTQGGGSEGTANPPRIWRNDPIDIERIPSQSRLPRGGAELTRAPTIGRDDIMRERLNQALNTARSAIVGETLQGRDPRIASTPLDQIPAANPPSDNRDDLDNQDSEQSFSFSWARTRSPEMLRRSPSPLDDSSEPWYRPLTWARVAASASGNTSTSIRQRLAPTVSSLLAAQPARDLPPPSLDAMNASYAPAIDDNQAETSYSATTNNGLPRRSIPSSGVRSGFSVVHSSRRSREETNRLVSQTLRMKKPCWLLYCGAGLTGRDGQTPSGFHWESSDDKDAATSSEGCGNLFCARGLTEVPQKVFDRSAKGKLEPAIASDLPPSSSSVGETGGMSWTTRGVPGCKGCATLDLACRHCGNIVGYRVVNPCTPCQKAPAASASGLLWHYRQNSTTVMPRLNGIVPTANVSASSPPGSPVPTPASTTVLCERTGRMIAAEAPIGTQMRWLDLPHAQIDFEDGLVGDPIEWCNPVDNRWLASTNVTGTRNRTSTQACHDPNGSTVNPPYAVGEEDEEAEDHDEPDRSTSTTVPESIFSPPPRPTERVLPNSIPIRTSLSEIIDRALSSNRSTGSTDQSSSRVGIPSLRRSGAIRRSRTTDTDELESNGDAQDGSDSRGRRVRARMSLSDPDAINVTELGRMIHVTGYGSEFEGTQGHRRERQRLRNLRLLGARRTGGAGSNAPEVIPLVGR